jgi:hypothetical protein
VRDSRDSQSPGVRSGVSATCALASVGWTNGPSSMKRRRYRRRSRRRPKARIRGFSRCRPRAVRAVPSSRAHRCWSGRARSLTCRPDSAPVFQAGGAARDAGAIECCIRRQVRGRRCSDIALATDGRLPSDRECMGHRGRAGFQVTVIRLPHLDVLPLWPGAGHGVPSQLSTLGRPIGGSPARAVTITYSMPSRRRGSSP